MNDPRLVVFDVDGTLVDSQGDILASMRSAFDGVGVPAPGRAEVLGIVGLSLEVAMPRLAPSLRAADHARLVEGYKAAYMQLRATKGASLSSPLYPGALDLLHTLHADPATLLGVATGKSRRGLDKLLLGHGLTNMFVTRQVADHHPSKPNPSMLYTAMSEVGVQPQAAVMIGDTEFDMEMARAAGMAAIGVSWGYHPRRRLAAADVVVDDFAALHDALQDMWSLT